MSQLLRPDLNALGVDADSFLGRAVTLGQQHGKLPDGFLEGLKQYVRLRALTQAQRQRSGIRLGPEEVEQALRQCLRCLDLGLADQTDHDVNAAIERLVAGDFESIRQRGWELACARLATMRTQARSWTQASTQAPPEAPSNAPTHAPTHAPPFASTQASPQGPPHAPTDTPPHPPPETPSNAPTDAPPHPPPPVPPHARELIPLLEISRHVPVWATVVPETWNGVDADGQPTAVDPVTDYEAFEVAAARLALLRALPRAAVKDVLAQHRGGLPFARLVRRIVLAVALERERLTFDQTTAQQFVRTAYTAGTMRAEVRQRVLEQVGQFLDKALPDEAMRRRMRDEFERELVALETAEHPEALL